MHSQALHFGLHHSRLSLKCRERLCSLAMVRTNSAMLRNVNWFQTSIGASAREQMQTGHPGSWRDLCQNQLPGRERDPCLYSLSPG